MEKKLRLFRDRSSTGIAIDSGSCTILAMEQFLLQVPKVPIPTIAVPEELDESEKLAASELPSRHHYHLMTPIFVTNSVVIAGMIGNSPHRANMPLRVIGGTMRVERGSLTGELSLLWLRALHSEGKMTSLDAAIIGSTGCDFGTYDVPTLCGDDTAESALKARLLGMARLRCSIFESEKLTPAGAIGHSFVPVSAKGLDLIVTDDGSSFKCEHVVNKFKKTARENGVGVAVVSLKDVKSHTESAHVNAAKVPQT